MQQHIFSIFTCRLAQHPLFHSSSLYAQTVYTPSYERLLTDWGTFRQPESQLTYRADGEVRLPGCMSCSLLMILSGHIPLPGAREHAHPRPIRGVGLWVYPSDFTT